MFEAMIRIAARNETTPTGTNQRDSQATICRRAVAMAPYATGHGRVAAHPCRPARGRRRSRKPSLPRLRRAAVRLALDPAGPLRAGQPLRELRPRGGRRAGRRRRRRCASSARLGDGSGPRIANRDSYRLRARQRRLGGPGAGRPLPVHGRVGAAAGGAPRPGREADPLGAGTVAGRDLADAAEQRHLRPQRRDRRQRARPRDPGAESLAAPDRLLRDRGAGDPGAGDRDPDRAGRRPVPAAARSSSCASNCSERGRRAGAS